MDDLELIKQKINIVDLIQEYLPLKKTGVNFKANCPFHQEKTPSFVVSPERGIWHCFGCLKSGDIFKFVMEKEGLEFIDALELLAKKAGITLKRQKSDVKDARIRLFETNQKALQFFQYILSNHQLGKPALEYLKKRGLTDQTIAQFQLGYAPNSWDSLTSFLTKRGFSLKELIDSGLIVESKRGGYDRFRGRIMFPLIDTKGQIIGFSGRILGQGEPKYINTPQTLIFNKSEFLFGMHLSKTDIRSKDQAILVEGEMDMILSYQAGVKQIVASKGTALTSGQIDLIKRHTSNIALCFDKDLAGDAASRRGIEMADQAGLNIKVIQIAGGKDPADLVSKDLNLWTDAVSKAEAIYDYYLQSVTTRFNSKSAEGKKMIAAELMPIWKTISDPIVFNHYLQKLAALLGMPDQALEKEIKKFASAATRYEEVLVSVAKEKTVSHSRRELLEEYLLVLLLKVPKGAAFIPNFPETLFLSEHFRTIYVLLVIYLDSIYFKSSAFVIDDFVKSLPEELVPIVDRLYLVEISDKLAVLRVWKEEIDGVVGELKRILIKSSLEKLSADIKNAELFGKIEILEVLTKKFRDLSLKLKTI